MRRRGVPEGQFSPWSNPTNKPCDDPLCRVQRGRRPGVWPVMTRSIPCIGAGRSVAFRSARSISGRPHRMSSTALGMLSASRVSASSPVSSAAQSLLACAPGPVLVGPRVCTIPIWCARRTGERQGVEVPRDEGVTNHVSPRAVRRAPRGVRRSVGSGSCGRANEHRKDDGSERRGFQIGRRQHGRPRYGERLPGSAVSENPCTHESLSSGPGRSSFCPDVRDGAA